MNKLLKTLIFVSASAMALNSFGATEQTVIATGNPSSNGWTLDGTNEFTSGGGDWAIYGTENAVRGLGGFLNVGESVSIDLATLGVANGDFVGVDFRDGLTTGIGFNFQGGGTEYNYVSDAGVTSTGIGFTTSFQTIGVTRTSGTQYTLSVGATNFTGLLLDNSATGIDTIRVFNETSGVGNDILFNNFSVIPETSSIAMLGLTGLAAGMIALLKRRKRV